MKRSFSVLSSRLLMVLLCIGILLPMALMSVGAAEQSTLAQAPVYVLAGSDFQAATDADSANNVTAILNKVVADGYTTFDGFMFCGDYSASWSYDTTLSGLEALKAAVSSKVGNIPNQFFVEGNHDNYKVPGITATGGYTTANYDVYVLGESDFAWREELSFSKALELAADLETWLAQRTVGEKPVFVLSHIPLHYSTRTRETNDGRYTKYIADVLNAAGQRGLNIVFMYGHNHGGYYDHYLGGATNYIAKGDTLWIGDPANVLNQPISYTLNFTYMNAGFTGYYSGVDCEQCKAGDPIDDDFTMSVFEITGDQVVVRRYDKNGLHAVKEKPGHHYYPNVECNFGYTLNTKTYASPQTIGGAAIEIVPNATLGNGSFRVGESVPLAVKNPTAASYTWVSSDPTVMSVTPGADGTAIVTALRAGYATITVSTSARTAETTTIHAAVAAATDNEGVFVEESDQWIYTLTDTMVHGKTYVIASHNKPGYTNILSAPPEGYGLQNATGIRIYGYPDGTPYILYDELKLGEDGEEIDSNGNSVYKYRTWKYTLTDPVNNAGTLHSPLWDTKWYIAMGDDETTAWMHDSTTVGSTLHWLDVKMKSVEWKWGSCLYSNVKTSDKETLWLGYSQLNNCWWIRDDGNWATEKLGDGSTSWLNTYVYEENKNVATAKLSTMCGVWDGESVGTYIVKTWTTGQVEYIPVELNWITDRNGEAVDLSLGGTLTGLTVTYNDVAITHNYSLRLSKTEVNISGQYYYRLVDGFTGEGRYLIVSENAPASNGVDDAFAMQSTGIIAPVTATPVHITPDRTGWPCILSSEVEDDMVWIYTNRTNEDYYWLEQPASVHGGGADDYNYLVFTDSSGTELMTTTQWRNPGFPGYDPIIHTSSNYYAGLTTVRLRLTIEHSDGTTTHDGRHIMFDGSRFFTVDDWGRMWGREVYIYEKTEMKTALFEKLIGTSGKVTVNPSAATETGTFIQLLLPNGMLHSVPVTVDMLYQGDTKLTNTDQLSSAKTLTGLTIKYGDEMLPVSYELVVSGTTSEGEPAYPNPGSVRYTKTLGSSGFDFSKTGVSKIDLAVTGIPHGEKLDILVVMDTSSSVSYLLDNGQSRIEAMRNALLRMIDVLQKPNSDGTIPDVQLAVCQFNDYTYFADPYNHLTNIPVFGDRGISEDYNGIVFDYANVQDLDNLDVARLAPRAGTNYDVAFQNAYDIVAARKAAHSDRRQVVVFMTDGICYQYNYVSYNSVGIYEDAAQSWLLGTLDEEDNTGIVPVQDFYHPEGKQWMAEAIKGSTGSTYKVIWNDSRESGVVFDASQHIRNVNGLGATIYSIGFGVSEADGDDLGYVASEILKKAASDPSKYYNASHAEELNAVFADIAGQVRKAATGAYVLDKMGPVFDMQMEAVINSQGTTAAEMPQITIKSYELYKAADVNGTTVTTEMIGTRKPNSGVVLETITFAKNGDGKLEVYSDQVRDKDGKSVNILGTDGIIRAHLFCYNTNTSGSVNISVNGAAVALSAETIYWYIGNISEREVELSYYVYLNDSLDKSNANQGVNAGDYATNQYANLIYKNADGAEVTKTSTSPVLNWKNATVNYAFYYVDESGNPITNLDTGATGTFAERIAVTTVESQTLNLNIDKSLQSVSLIAGDVLPAGHRLFDSEASYTVHVNSGLNNSVTDFGGCWTIGYDAALPRTTYVTGNGITATTQVNNTSSSTKYDGTTVWFAVVYERRTQPDVVVIDYGIPVEIDVLGNDSFASGTAVDKLCASDYENVVSVGHVAKNASGQPAVADTIGNANSLYTASLVNGKIRFALNKGLGMQMDEEQVFAYRVPAKYTQMVNGVRTEVDHYYYSTVTVVPATTIYYEDSFVTFGVHDYTTKEALTVDGVAWEPTSNAVSDTQNQDRPGASGNLNLDADNVYGYDGAYTECSTYSLGSAMKVRVGTQTIDGKEYHSVATASFTFTGTGFDLISMTTDTTGTIVVQATNKNTGKVYNDLVDTYYGYEYVEVNGQYVWQPSNGTNQKGNTLYQVPVLKMENMDYGTYDVLITISHAAFFDHGQVDGKCYDFYLDAIRIYDPAKDGENSDVVEDAYVKDKEGWPAYTELRNMIIPANTFDELTTDDISGVVFIDNTANSGSYVPGISDYTNYGPNNEVYLANGQAISFALQQGGNVASVQIAMKSVIGTPKVTYYASGEAATTRDIKTATDLYYDITNLNNKVVVIKNTGDGILSITNIKVTYTQKPADTQQVSETLRVREGIIVNAAAMNAVLEEMKNEAEQDPVEPVVPGTIDVLGASLSFEDEVFTNLYFSTSVEAEELGLLTWQVLPECADMDNADNVFSGAVYDRDNDRYMVRTAGIPAKMLGDDIFMAVYAKLADGSCIYSKVITYSPKQYAMSRLEKSSDDDLKALCVAMLNYGAAAQEYFGYKTDDLMNAQLTQEQQMLVVDYSADLFSGAVAADESKIGAFAKTADGFSSRSATVSFDDAFAINYYFAPDAAVNEDVTFYYWTAKAYAEAETLTVENASGTAAMVKGSNGAYWAQITDISAKELDDTYYVAAVYTSGDEAYCTGVIAYSLSTYCMRNAASGMGELAQATAVYGYHAKIYFGQ